MTPQKALQAYASAEKARNSARFFKTGPGQYGEGDIFLGVTVPECRIVAKQFADLSFKGILKLLQSPYHEQRLTALLILVKQYSHGTPEQQQKIYDLYLSNTTYVNNWDLVDSSAEYIVGPFLGAGYKPTLTKLARSKSIWERRIAMLACFAAIKQGDPAPAFYSIELLEQDREDLIQKAVGWMLREIGKHSGRKTLEDWLLASDHYKQLPRTTLRYAIEHFSPAERRAFLQGTAPTR